MDDGSLEGRYANAFVIGFNAFEFVLDFGQRYSEQVEPRVHSRIVTSPSYAKLLLNTLCESVTQYEDTFGAIREALPVADRPLGLRLRGQPIKEAIMPDTKQPYGSGVNEVGLPTGDEGSAAGFSGAGGEAFDFGGMFNTVKSWISKNDDKVIQVVAPWLKRIVAKGSGLDALDLPNATLITQMVLPSQVARLSPPCRCCSAPAGLCGPAQLA